MKKALFSILAAAGLMLGACSPTYDKDNPEESVKTMTEKLSPRQQAELAQALANISSKLSGNTDYIGEALDGKTAEEIVDYSANMAQDVFVSVSAPSLAYTPAPAPKRTKTSAPKRRPSGPPRVDVDNFEASLEEVRKSLNIAEQLEFAEALMGLSILYAGNEEGLKQFIDGKTGREIILLSK